MDQEYRRGRDANISAAVISAVIIPHAQLKPSLPVTGWNYGVQKSKDALHHTTKCVRGSAGLWESVVVMINKRRKLSA